MQLFEEVLNDYIDEQTGEAAIDGYFHNQEQGVIVAWVRPDGSFRLGDYSKPDYLLCSRVQVALHEAILRFIRKG